MLIKDKTTNNYWNCILKMILYLNMIQLNLNVNLYFLLNFLLENCKQLNRN